MKQIKWITVINIIILIFFQCKDNTNENNQNNKPKADFENVASDKVLDSLKNSASPGDVIITDTYDTDHLKDGDYQFFYPDSTIKVKGTVINGKREGIWTAFHPNGLLQSENHYKNGVLDGKCMAKSADGEMIYIGYYSNGKYDGQWLYFDQNGEIAKEVLYNKGKISKVVEGKDLPK